MSETRKRLFTLELTDKETKAFIERCEEDGTNPAEVLEGFICDLTGAERTRGSDERTLATQYYERCGYGFFFPGEYRTFTQWLLSACTLETVADALDNIKTFEEEIEYLNKHPEEMDEGEIESLEEAIRECEGEIEDLYKEYATQAQKPDTLEDGLNNVRSYLDNIENIMKGGII